MCNHMYIYYGAFNGTKYVCCRKRFKSIDDGHYICIFDPDHCGHCPDGLGVSKRYINV